MKNNPLTLSIVIPVYNEERYIKACLEAIDAQTVPPDEVILVDNNTTDKSIEMAKKFSFVRIIKEPRQSQVFAQKTGFDAATGDIIGRIDGDTILPPDWVEKIKTAFRANKRIVAVTGGPKPYDVQLKFLDVAIFRVYNIIASWIAGVCLLWGSNCALRRNAWLQVSDKVLQRSDIWEDFDLAFCLAEQGSINFLKGIEVGTSFRAINQPPLVQLDYQFRAVRTFALRTNLFRASLLALTRLTVVVFYPLVLLDQYILTPLAHPNRRA